MTKNKSRKNESIGLADCIYYGKKITQKWGSDDVCLHENSRGRWKFWFWVGRRYYIVNVVDYITNNEYKNLEILVEEVFTAEEFQIIGENKYKLSSCLLQEVLPMMLMLIDESTRKLPNSQLAKPFICEKCRKSYRKQQFFEIHMKHDEYRFGTSACWMCCVSNLLS